MKRIGELTMQVELLEAKTETFGPLGAAEVAAMSAATSPGTGLAYGLRRVCAAWGMARSSFYAMTSGQHAEQPPAKASGTEARDLGPGAAGGAIEADLEASPWEGEGYRKVWARLRVCRRHPGCPQAGAPPDAREQSALAPSLPPPWRQSP